VLVELGVHGAIVGHWERRHHFGETDETVGRRAAAALEAGLWVIACIGESETERERGETEDVLGRPRGAPGGRGGGVGCVACRGEGEAERGGGDPEAFLGPQLVALESHDDLVIAY